MNISENIELAELKSQMENLKKQLSDQEIINDKLIRESMKKKMSWIKKYIIFEVCLMPLIIFAWLGIRYYCHLSWANYFFMIILCFVSIIVDYYININSIKDDDYNRNNLVETIKKLTKMKRQRAIQMVIQMPLLVCWILWAGVEAYNALPGIANEFQQGFIQGGIIGGAIGGVIGIIFAVSLYFKMQRTNDEIINQINETINDDINVEQ